MGRFFFKIIDIIFNAIKEFFFFSSRRRHTRLTCDWSSDVCSSDLAARMGVTPETVSRWEHGVIPIGPQADRLLRMLTVRAVPVREYSTALLVDIGDEPETYAMALGLRMHTSGWYVEEFALQPLVPLGQSPYVCALNLPHRDASTPLLVAVALAPAWPSQEIVVQTSWSEHVSL